MPEKRLKQWKAGFQHKDIVGATQSGRVGLGMQKYTYFYRASSYEKRKLVADEIRASQEEAHQTKAAGLVQQRTWTRWENMEARSLSWSEMWSMEPLMVKFLIQSTYNVLPCPTNLKLWNLSEDDRCVWCHEHEVQLNTFLMAVPFHWQEAFINGDMTKYSWI